MCMQSLPNPVLVLGHSLVCSSPHDCFYMSRRAVLRESLISTVLSSGPAPTHSGCTYSLGQCLLTRAVLQRVDPCAHTAEVAATLDTSRWMWARKNRKCAKHSRKCKRYSSAAVQAGFQVHQLRVCVWLKPLLLGDGSSAGR